MEEGQLSWDFQSSRGVTELRLLKQQGHSWVSLFFLIHPVFSVFVSPLSFFTAMGPQSCGQLSVSLKPETVAI